MKAGTVIFVIALALCSLVAAAIAQRPAVDSKVADEEDILAAVIRQQMDEWIRTGDKSQVEAKTKIDRDVAKQLNYMTFFISLDGKDPSDEFLNRFRDVPRSIRKVSSEKPQKGPHQPVDGSNGQAGIVFSADKIHWLTKESVTVEGGYYCGGLCAGEYTFSVERKDGKWIVQSSKMNWIS